MLASLVSIHQRKVSILQDTSEIPILPLSHLYHCRCKDSHGFYTIQKLVPAYSSTGMLLLLYLASPTAAVLILEVLSVAQNDKRCELNHLAHFAGHVVLDHPGEHRSYHRM